VFAVFGDQPWLIELSDQVVEVVIGLEYNVSAPSPVAAGRAALGSKRLPQKRNATTTSVAGAREDLDFINEHKNKTGEASGLARNDCKTHALVTRNLHGFRLHAHQATRALELNPAIHQRKQGPIPAGADVLARVKSCPALANDNAPRGDKFTTKALNAKTLAVAVASVPCAATTLLMCHNSNLLLLRHRLPDGTVCFNT
jgi:hypothetical protein